MLPDEKKPMRDRARVEVAIRVQHAESEKYGGTTEIARVTLDDEAVLEYGDGGLADNEHVFTRLVDRVTGEARGKVEQLLSDQWSEKINEAESERRGELIHNAEQYIAGADDVGEQNRRRRMLGEFLNHDFGGEGTAA